MKQAVKLLAIGLGAFGNFPNLAFNAGSQARDVFQVLASVLDLLDANV